MEVHGEDHPETLRAMWNLASILIQQGNYTAAKEVLQRCSDSEASWLTSRVKRRRVKTKPVSKSCGVMKVIKTASQSSFLK